MKTIVLAIAGAMLLATSCLTKANVVVFTPGAGFKPAIITDGKGGYLRVFISSAKQFSASGIPPYGIERCAYENDDIVCKDLKIRLAP